MATRIASAPPIQIGADAERALHGYQEANCSGVLREFMLGTSVTQADMIFAG